MEPFDAIEEPALVLSAPEECLSNQQGILPTELTAADYSLLELGNAGVSVPTLGLGALLP